VGKLREHPGGARGRACSCPQPYVPVGLQGVGDQSVGRIHLHERESSMWGDRLLGGRRPVFSAPDVQDAVGGIRLGILDLRLGLELRQKLGCIGGKNQHSVQSEAFPEAPAQLGMARRDLSPKLMLLRIALMPTPERLNSWKEIAGYLQVSVRTAQRWETTEGMPVRRHKHLAVSSVFASRQELDAWWNSRPDLQRISRNAEVPAPSIAVLPFANLNRDGKGEFLSDGLTEELINALASVPGLQVIARTSAFYFKGKTGDVRAIGARLGVRTILEGSLRRNGDQLRVTAQLIDVADGCHLWSGRFDREMKDLFEMQDEIACAIVEALRVQLSGPMITKDYVHDIDSYAQYLEGRFYWNKSTPAGFAKAVECFEGSLAKNGRMAPAWAGLANCYAIVGPLAGIPPDEALRKARDAAVEALEIDGMLPEAYVALGFIAAAFDYDWAGGGDHFRRALEINPDHAMTHVLYAAMVLAPQGRLEEAEQHTRRACELDPFSAATLGNLGMLFLMSNRLDEAIVACRRALDLDPGFPWAHRALGEAYMMKERYEQASDEFLKIDSPVLAAGYLGCCYARSGREQDARNCLQELERTGNPLLAYQIAVLRLGLGDRDTAFTRLAEACERRCPGVHWLRLDPIWDELRPDSRFSTILRKMHLCA
jgi:adenylate cyclase